MKIVRITFALLLLPTLSMLCAQTPALGKEQAPPGATVPLVVDVHPSPYRSSIYYRTNIGNQRFDMRDATLLDMISVAYNRQDQAILGGPTWIDFDRFDVVAKISTLQAPSFSADPTNSLVAQNPYDQIRPVLKRVLEERFHLVSKVDDRLLPGYVMTVAKDGVKMAEAKDPAATNSCQSEQDKATPGQFVVTCTSFTAEQIVSSFGGIYPHPIVDHTGLKKSYDFTFKINFGQVRTQEEYIRIFTEAFSKQLGLAIAPGDVSQPVIVVEKIDHTPTPNLPDIAKLIPPLPDLEFEVASIKPTADGEQQGMVRPAGSQITFTGLSLQDLLVRAWELPTGAMLGNAVDLLPKQRYTITVKLPPDIDARAVYMDPDQINDMLKKLLMDRFGIKVHWDQQTLDGWVLLAAGPKLKTADPNARTFCKYGPPEGEKNMEGADSQFDNQSHCQNVTMGQFADMLQNLAKSEIKNHVQDKTGLTGSYDLTFYYTSARKLRAANAAATAAAKESGATSSDPVGGMGIQDAFRKELGLRLEKQPLSQPILVLDHFEKTPTEN
jgi:uncharacterized protein (TIGR03435 family)